jgi:hypothetical protein
MVRVAGGADSAQERAVQPSESHREIQKRARIGLRFTM